MDNAGIPLSPLPDHLNGSRHATTTRIERLLRRREKELLLLRFHRREEIRFHTANLLNRTASRTVYLTLATALIAIVLLVDFFVLDLNPAFLRLRWTIGFGVMVPALLLAILVVNNRHTRYHADVAISLAIVVCSLGFIYLRQIGHGQGILVPLPFTTIAAIVGLLLCRIRLLRFLPVQFFIYVAVIAGEVALGHNRARMFEEIYSYHILMGTILGGAWLVEYQNRVNWLRRDWLQHLSSRDDLTGLINKRFFNQEFRRLFALARQEQRPITVAMIDVDHFKAYNDLYGHGAGDRCLKQVAACINAKARRGGDLAGRVGGEEFAVVWYGNDAAVSQQLLEEMIDGVRDLAMPHAQSGTGTPVVTISAGAYWLIPDHDSRSADALQRSDMLLYQSKREGRDRLNFACGI